MSRWRKDAGAVYRYRYPPRQSTALTTSFTTLSHSNVRLHYYPRTWAHASRSHSFVIGGKGTQNAKPPLPVLWLSGHLRVNCPTRPSTKDTTAVSASPNILDVPITLANTNVTVETMALIDSGAAGNFIDINFANSHKLPLLPCEHNPRISWTTKQIQQWSEPCQRKCLQFQFHATNPKSSLSTETPVVSDLPAEYQDLSEVFSKSRASQLPPHRSSDCAIDLLPGAMPTRGRVFPLSQPESEAMKAYIEEELAKGFIRPSTSPASAGFFYDHASITEVSTISQLNSVTHCLWFQPP